MEMIPRVSMILYLPKNRIFYLIYIMIFMKENIPVLSLNELFESDADNGEKAVIVAGPNELNIASSTLRMIANSSGVQLARPGDKFRLDRTVLVQKGMSNHHKFAWNKFSPFVAWEK